MGQLEKHEDDGSVLELWLREALSLYPIIFPMTAHIILYQKGSN